jgi:exosortase A-associated hydrolase 1
MRRLIAFPCDGEQLMGSLDPATGTTGLLIVSGGGEVRAGTHRGMALLAQTLAARGVPVFRFDRRGVGDSTGSDDGWQSSLPDIAAAAAAFRAEQPRLTRLVGMGNCDAATALARFGRDAGLDALILTNPWAGYPADTPPPAAALGRHYLRRLAQPATWRRLLTGRLALRRSAGSLLARREDAPLSEWNTALPTTAILARGDRTAQLFQATLRGTIANIRTVDLPTASHSFADAGDALADAVLAALTR